MLLRGGLGRGGCGGGAFVVGGRVLARPVGSAKNAVSTRFLAVQQARKAECKGAESARASVTEPLAERRQSTNRTLAPA